MNAIHNMHNNITHRATLDERLIEAVPHMIERFRTSPVFGRYLDENKMWKKFALFASPDIPYYAMFYTTNDDGLVNAAIGGMVVEQFAGAGSFGIEMFFISLPARNPQGYQIIALLNTMREWALAEGAQYVLLGQSAQLVDEDGYTKLAERCKFDKVGTLYIHHANGDK